MTMRSLVITILVPVIVVAVNTAGIAHAQITDCTNQPVGTQCKPIGSAAGTLGTCQDSSNIFAGRVCIANTSSSGSNQTLTSPPLPSTQTLTSPPISGSGSNDNVTLINPLNAGTSLESFLINILQFIIYIGGIVVVLMIVFVGYKFIAAQGNSTKIEEARNMLLWTVVGALILLGAQAIAMGIQATVTALTGG